MRASTLLRTLAVASLALALPSALSAADEAAEKLADAVMKASGGGAWPSVKRIRFSFVVEEPGKTEPLLLAKHDWDLKTYMDTAEWKGKKATINLLDPASMKTEDEKAAFARWTNDSYWLVAPLKLKDKGVTLKYGGKMTVDGRELEVLDVTFANVGMTSADHYMMYIDPKTSLLVKWDYMPAPDKKITSVWEDYRDFNGLKLATKHDFAGKIIKLTDVTVDR
jgi:hypothetical protein